MTERDADMIMVGMVSSLFPKEIQEVLDRHFYEWGKERDRRIAQELSPYGTWEATRFWEMQCG